jgi:hypothetical protein
MKFELMNENRSLGVCTLYTFHTTHTHTPHTFSRYLAEFNACEGQKSHSHMGKVTCVKR